MGTWELLSRSYDSDPANVQTREQQQQTRKSLPKQDKYISNNCSNCTKAVWRRPSLRAAIHNTDEKSAEISQNFRNLVNELTNKHRQLATDIIEERAKATGSISELELN